MPLYRQQQLFLFLVSGRTFWPEGNRENGTVPVKPLLPPCPIGCRRVGNVPIPRPSQPCDQRWTSLGKYRFGESREAKGQGRETSRIKEVCRETRPTSDLRRPATPFGISKGVTFSALCYLSYACMCESLRETALYQNYKMCYGGF